MTEYNEGDLIEIRKGDVVVRDRLAESAHLHERLYLPAMYEQIYVDALPTNGWHVTVLEKAAPKVELPTEPGLYLDKNGEAWRLSLAGNWVPAHDPGYLAGGAPWTDKAELLANRRGDLINRVPFTRLESRAETVKAVIEFIEGVPDHDDYSIDLARKTFGVE